MHKTIQLSNLSLSFPHKTCFEGFNSTITDRSRIAIIGRNGSGKSTLLKMLQGEVEPSFGDVVVPVDVKFGYVPQVVYEFDSLSGGERFNKALSAALRSEPNILLLDEPTNHLDESNRNSLMRMLNSFEGSIIVASHDAQLLRNCIDTIWHIVDGRVEVFSGNYDDYMREIHIKRAAIERELSNLKRQKQGMHKALMAEQTRASKSKARGEKSISQRKWPTIVSNAKALRAEETTGSKKANIDYRKQELSEKLSKLQLTEIIVPKFSLSPAELGHKILVAISGGSAGYIRGAAVINDINLRISPSERLAITGANGSGKSTLIKAILNEGMRELGEWYSLKSADIGYLDQHYDTLSPDKTVLESIQELMPNWSVLESRKHLNDFLFRKNEEVNASINTLSGGEKARLSLACIAAKTPKLLILDEVTNNVDLETREHIIQVLKGYPGAMIIISHDKDFLNALEVSTIIPL